MFCNTIQVKAREDRAWMAQRNDRHSEHEHELACSGRTINTDLLELKMAKETFSQEIIRFGNGTMEFHLPEKNPSEKSAGEALLSARGWLQSALRGWLQSAPRWNNNSWSRFI